ncbi:MAG: GFA family protein [Pseudooceanicola sp.]|nr:GFA family protein [Pseudooceanicola sp.]
MLTGRCYCGDLRYEAEGDPVLKAQCHCRECQYISGGGPNYFMLIPKDGFRYTKGTPKNFARPDLPHPVTREFCRTCGTHILTRLIGREQVVLKVGTLDDPSTAYGAPRIAIYTVDRQPFHIVADGLPLFERLPPR